MYDLGDRLLMVASDRISAYDVVLPTAIPDKGKVLTGLSAFWFEHTAGDRAQPPASRSTCRTRCAAARWSCASSRSSPSNASSAGYLSGSGWKEYQRDGHGLRHRAAGRPDASPTGCRSRSSRPRRRPSSGSTTRTSTSTGPPRSSATAALMEELRRLSLEIYTRCAQHAERNGIILADTKFEFGRDADGTIVLADEVLTPDSSRFWPLDSYEPGGSQPSFDKQYVRDWLDQSGLGPLARRARSCPPRSSQSTRAKYVEAYERLAGRAVRAPGSKR